MQDLEVIVEQIKSNPLFLRLKDVVENIDGFHDHEDVFSHSIKTADVAARERDGEFIKNPEVKNLFQEWMEADTFGMQRRDIVVLTALLHDCGKILSYTENGKTSTLITKRPGKNDQTVCPGHEYYGGKIVVPAILKDVDLAEDLKKYIADCVSLHGVFNDSSYYLSKHDWDINDIVLNVKSKAEGYYVEELFNAYCDCYTAKPFAPARNKIQELFNSPSLYVSREYILHE